jgi:hypothetical protein
MGGTGVSLDGLGAPTRLLDGMRDIAPSLLAISKKKNFAVHKALNDNL